MDYNIDREDGIVVLGVQGNVLTGIHNQEIMEKVGEEIEEGNNRFVINLGETGFINSNGLNLLLNVLTKCRKSGGDVVLSNVPQELGKLLTITKLNAIFTTKPSKEDAIRHLNSSK